MCMDKTELSAADVAAPIKIDIWSDVVCGWCYIGKRRLEAALERFTGHVDIEYHSFELAADTPPEFDGAIQEYLTQRRGMPLPQAQRMLHDMTTLAATVGLDYHYDRTQPTNTVLAHELLHFAKSKGRQLEMNERLLDAYFQRAEHVGRIPDLVRLAQEMGMDGDEVNAALTKHLFLADVKADIAQAAALGIQGVPFYVVNGRYGLSGAQDPDAFLQVLERVAEEDTLAFDHDSATR
jgi:predicted DsbA family dithiol-disulfide isomerase